MDGSTTSVAVGGVASRFTAGARIAGRYTVQRWLGKGGMGEVYQVVDQQLGEVVALKTLADRLVGDPTALARFQAEVKNARRITHPNVCRTFEFGTHADDRGTIHFLTMELLEGETLEARLERGPIDRGELLAILEQIAPAVDAAHAAGVVHRDLKPSNIVLVSTGPAGAAPRAVVTDFGLARRIDESRVTDEGWVGTPAYIAPEQLEGSPGGPAVDLYALGVILFRAVTGRLPFQGESAAVMALQRVAHDAPSARQLDPSIPAAWDRAIARCLERRAEDRFASAHDVIAALREQATVPRSRAGRRRARWAAIAAVAIAVITAVAIVMLRERGRPPSTSGGLPTAERVVSVEVAPADGASIALPVQAPAFEKAAAWVIAEAWRTLEARRRFRIVSGRPGNVVARVVWHPDGDGVAARLEVGSPGHLAAAGEEVQTSSIRDAARALYPQLAARAGEGQADVELFPEEVDEMRELAAPSPEAYKEIIGAFDDEFRIVAVPDEPFFARLDELIARYPGWAQVVALRIARAGWFSDETRRFTQEQLAVARTAGRDPLGVEMLEAVPGRNGRSLDALRHVRSTHRTNRVLMAWLFNPSDFVTDEMGGVAAEMMRRFPHLQFGANAYGYLVDHGFRKAAGELLTEWLGRAPGQEQAWIMLSRAQSVERPDPAASAAGRGGHDHRDEESAREDGHRSPPAPWKSNRRASTDHRLLLSTNGGGSARCPRRCAGPAQPSASARVGRAFVLGLGRHVD